MAFDPNAAWVPPTYAGSDPAYAAWLAGAQLQGTDAVSQARLRKAQLAESERQALQDLDTRAVQGRRSLQGSMLQRGLFGSGEAQRRQQEYDAQIAQGQQRAQQAFTDQSAQADQNEQSALSNLGMQAATQVSQAMLRDALATYQAQQSAAMPAPQPTYTAPVPQPSYTPPPAQPAPGAATPPPRKITSSASLYAAQSSAPKPAAPALTPLHGKF